MISKAKLLFLGVTLSFYNFSTFSYRGEQCISRALLEKVKLIAQKEVFKSSRARVENSWDPGPIVGVCAGGTRQMDYLEDLTVKDAFSQCEVSGADFCDIRPIVTYSPRWEDVLGQPGKKECRITATVFGYFL